jgi:uncharacterized membrane protein (UPF0127 family)
MTNKLPYILSLCLLAACQQRSNQTFSTTQLSVGAHQVIAEVAESEAQQRQGLMWRTSLAPNQGMLFKFPYVDKSCFWMKNTLLPLSVAFIGEQGQVLHLAEMQPKSEMLHCSPVPVKYGLEMNTGWFAKNGIKIGTQVQGLTK